MDDGSSRYSPAEREEYDLDEHVRPRPPTPPSDPTPPLCPPDPLLLSLRAPKQAYLFDTQGYIKIEGALSREEVAKLNASFDQYEHTMRPSGNYADGSENPRISAPDAEAPSRLDLSSNPLEWPQPWCEPVRECLCHPAVAPYLNMILGKGYRLDHGPSLFLHKKDFAGWVMPPSSLCPQA